MGRTAEQALGGVVIGAMAQVERTSAIYRRRDAARPQALAGIDACAGPPSLVAAAGRLLGGGRRGNKCGRVQLEAAARRLEEDGRFVVLDMDWLPW